MPLCLFRRIPVKTHPESPLIRSISVYMILSVLSTLFSKFPANPIKQSRHDSAVSRGNPFNSNNKKREDETSRFLFSLFLFGFFFLCRFAALFPFPLQVIIFRHIKDIEQKRQTLSDDADI